VLGAALRHIGLTKNIPGNSLEVLDRIAVVIELEASAQRGEVGLLQCGRDRFLVGQVALERLDGAVDQYGGIVPLHGIGAGHDVVGGFIGCDEFLVLRIVEIGRPVRAAEHADRGVLLRRQRRLVDRERRQNRNLVGQARLPVLLYQGHAHAARHEREYGVGLH
jgi:hypothetical protein